MVLGLCLAGLLALGLAAYAWIPIASDLPLLSRMERTYPFFLNNHVLSLKHLLTFLVPEALGTPLDHSYTNGELWEDVGYFGLIPLCLACLGAWQRRKDRTVRFLTIAFLCSILLAFETPLLRFVFDVVPGYGLFRGPTRILFITSYLGIALSGYGMESLLRMIANRTKKMWMPKLLVSSILLIMMGEGVFYATNYIQMVPHDKVVPPLPFKKTLDEDPERYRIATVGRYALNYGWAESNQLQIISGYDPIILDHYARYFHLLQTNTPGPPPVGNWLDLTTVRRVDMLDALNVRYVIAPAPIQWPDKRFVEVDKFEDVPAFVFYRGMNTQNLWLYRNQAFLRRAFWVTDVISVGNAKIMESALLKTNLRRQAVIGAEDGKAARYPSLPDPKDRVDIARSEPGNLVLQLTNANRRFLVISEVWHPGWTATIDGRPLPLHQTDLALLGAWIEPGEHRLVLAFTPSNWRLGLILSAIALAIWLFLLIHDRRRRHPTFPR
jgi:hypothetical protein